MFVDVLTDFYFIFKTLEDNLEKYKDHPCVKGVVPENMLRTPAFEQDLRHFLGENWQGSIQPSPLAVAYCDRINKVANTDPALLLA